MDSAQWDQFIQRLANPTREQRIRMAYAALAGSYPGPNQSAIAAILAHRIIEIEDARQ